MSATTPPPGWYCVSIAGGHHKPDTVAWGPYARDWALDACRVSANPFEVADGLTGDGWTRVGESTWRREVAR